MIVEVRLTHALRAIVGVIRRHLGRGAGVGKVKNAGAEKARRPREECIVAAADSLRRFGLLKFDGDSP
jgi:hypothetical protein